MLFHLCIFWLSLGSSAFASTIPLQADPFPTYEELVKRQDGACTNTPLTRQCWSNGYSIATDFDAKQPPDGVEVVYNLEITNVTRTNPDGSGGNRIVMLVNNQYPGPVIRGKWGDTFVINVKNSMEHNGTGIHWHGVRQLNSCQEDGVPGVTECPIAPGKTRQYRFRATQFGTSWYHSHFSIQYGDGVVGPLIIEGPATANYDVDLGTLPLTDWYYTPVFTLNEMAQHSTRGAPIADNILVNGTHVNAAGGGSYAKMTVVKGKTYRVRLINTAVDSFFTVSLDGHPFKVITSDFVPIKPYIAEQVTLAIGQRYDVVFTANQTVSNYWFRVNPASDQGCGRNNINGKVTTGAILHYDGAPDTNPTSTGITLRTSCNDEDSSKLLPFVPNTVPSSIVAAAQNQKLAVDHFQNASNANLFRWLVSGTPHIVDWNNPTLETVLAGSDAFSGSPNMQVLPTSDWYLWWVQSTDTSVLLPHPLHLHGHDFYIVGRGAGTWDGSTTGLTFANPPRRDTAILPAGGYLLLAFPADNPGMWIMHCHIAWHASQGLSMQFMERRSEIKSVLGEARVLGEGCGEWDAYWPEGSGVSVGRPYEQTDSGI
ncbi:laccase, multicopper oxidase, benzenediol:oxygen oxidorectuctase [Coniothyrium glycines]